MAEGIIDRLEIVEIKPQKCHDMVPCTGTFKCVVDTLIEGGFVEQAGQLIVV